MRVKLKVKLWRIIILSSLISVFFFLSLCKNGLSEWVDWERGTYLWLLLEESSLAFTIHHCQNTSVFTLNRLRIIRGN